MERLARLPVIGDEVNTDRFLLRVLSIEDHRVGRVAIEFRDETASDSDDAERPVL